MSQSLVACKSCKNPISTKASSCPSCGRRRHSEGFNFFAYPPLAMPSALYRTSAYDMEAMASIDHPVFPGCPIPSVAR